MPDHTRKREVGRGERTLPGVWRLRLPLPWPGVPHCNAWAIAAGDGIVMVDTGMHEPGSEGHLDRALGQVNLKVETTRLLICTHAHRDHYGQAATIVERAGCELWMHPDHEHMRAAATDPDAALVRGERSSAAAARDDVWQRAVELLFERLAVRWTVAGVATEGPAALLARFRAATREERSAVREALRAHLSEHFRELKAP